MEEGERSLSTWEKMSLHSEAFTPASEGQPAQRVGHLPAIEAAWSLREPNPSVPKEDRGRLPADIPASGSSAASPKGRRKQRARAESHHLPGQLWSQTQSITQQCKDTFATGRAVPCLGSTGLDLMHHPQQQRGCAGSRPHTAPKSHLLW